MKAWGKDLAVMGLLQLTRFTGSHVDLGNSKFKAIAFKVRDVDLGFRVLGCGAISAGKFAPKP